MLLCRLVARTLERRWEEALRDQRRLEDEYDRFLRAQPARLSDDERARVLALSEDIPALWGASGTTASDRKEVVRLLVERVVVHLRGQVPQPPEWLKSDTMATATSSETGMSNTCSG